ncbi:MAG: integral membrane protein-like protein [Linnemannia elongata]|nr:MAG: integral membrane protein-like protein [Linnemannia elongata]
MIKQLTNSTCYALSLPPSLLDQDMTCVKNCDNPDPKTHEHFEQPIWQTLNMFMGEILCLVAASIFAFLAEKYGRAKWADLILDAEEDDILAVIESDCLLSSPTPAYGHGHGHGNGHAAPLKKKLEGPLVLLLWLPTLCDMTASTLMNVGLIYCAASVYQMLRGALVIFTGLLSVMFLGRKLLAYEWFALFTIVAGIATVGLASIITPATKDLVGNADPDSDEAIQAAKAILGIFLVLFAQIFTATQFVVEEKFLSGYQIAPLRAVGFEGLFGTITVLVAMPILHFTIGASHPGSYFDLNAGWEQIKTYPQIWIPSIVMLFSISSFNFFGISVTKIICATSRSTIDSCRTLFIWAISLYFGWEKFIPLQVLGFALLVYGTFVFNGVIEPHVCAPPKAAHPDENRPLLNPNA